MTSQKQVEANRRNALKCTGPKTPEGKAVSRFNAFRHGLRARTLVLPGDDRSEFDRFSADLHKAYDPQNKSERLLVETMAAAECQLARLQRSESSLFIEQQGAIDAAHLPLLDRFSQAQASLERTSIRAYQKLSQLAKTRQHQPKGQADQSIVSNYSGLLPYPSSALR